MDNELDESGTIVCINWLYHIGKTIIVFVCKHTVDVCVILVRLV